jgi:hypothetical protein
MRAIQITETGGPEVLRLAELPEPEPGPRQLGDTRAGRTSPDARPGGDTV